MQDISLSITQQIKKKKQKNKNKTENMDEEQVVISN